MRTEPSYQTVETAVRRQRRKRKGENEVGQPTLLNARDLRRRPEIYLTSYLTLYENAIETAEAEARQRLPVAGHEAALSGI